MGIEPGGKGRRKAYSRAGESTPELRTRRPRTSTPANSQCPLEESDETMRIIALQLNFKIIKLF